MHAGQLSEFREFDLDDWQNEDNDTGDSFNLYTYSVRQTCTAHVTVHGGDG